MSDFDAAIGVVLGNEGGYVCDPADPGGETKYGISKRAYPELDIKNLTLDQAKDIYRRDFWRFSAVLNQDVATKLLDMAVNFGPAGGKELALEALQHVRARDVNLVPGPVMLRALRFVCAKKYAQIVAEKPKEVEFLNGWLWRAVQ